MGLFLLGKEELFRVYGSFRALLVLVILSHEKLFSHNAKRKIEENLDRRREHTLNYSCLKTTAALMSHRLVFIKEEKNIFLGLQCCAGINRITIKYVYLCFSGTDLDLSHIHSNLRLCGWWPSTRINIVPSFKFPDLRVVCTSVCQSNCRCGIQKSLKLIGQLT